MKTNVKVLKIFLIFALIFIQMSFSCPETMAIENITIKLWVGTSTMLINGIKKPIDTEGTKPVIVSGRTLVPIRAIIEALGGNIEWEAKTQKITVVLENDSLELLIGSSKATLNGKTLSIDNTNATITPLIINGRTMVPLRFVGETFGAKVEYTESTKMITLVYAKSKTSLLPDNSDLLLGNPSGAVNNVSSKDNYLMNSGYYSLSYNENRATPNWVSWHIDNSSLGTIDRSNNFRADTSLPNGWYQVKATSYSGSGFDRGHNCPSADRTSTYEANSSTFLMSNMIPQAPKNNEQLWANFENYLRSLVKEGNEVYIIMGSYGAGGTGSKGYKTTIDNGRITVPAQIWKVAVVLPEGKNDLTRISTTTRVIAINTPNTNAVSLDWKTYLTSVDEIEEATKYDLLSNLSVNLQKVLEARIDN